MKSQPDISNCTDEELTAMAGHVLLEQATHKLGVTAAQLADILGVATQTVWRWMRDPELFASSSREIDPTARRVVIWMLRDGRPACWPAPARAGWPLPDRDLEQNEGDL